MPFWLRLSGLISTEVALFGFTCLFIFVGLVIYLLPDLQELNLKELKLVLREIKDAEKRIYARVDTLKQLSILLADILLMHDLNIGRLSSTDDDGKLLRKWHDKKRSELLGLIGATPHESNHILRFRDLFDNFDSACARPQSEPGRMNAITEARAKIQEQLKREIS
jgi:hypothetical protein